MDFGNHTDGFAAFFGTLRNDMLSSGPAYSAALQKSYSNSVDYRDSILTAYQKDGFNLPVDLAEPDERIRFEIWNYFSRQPYDTDTEKLFQFMPVIVKILDEKFWYNSDCVEATDCIHTALRAKGAKPDGLHTIGQILGVAPYPLKEPPEFCPMITPAQRDIGIGLRHNAPVGNGPQPE